DAHARGGAEEHELRVVLVAKPTGHGARLVIDRQDHETKHLLLVRQFSVLPGRDRRGRVIMEALVLASIGVDEHTHRSPPSSGPREPNPPPPAPKAGPPPSPLRPVVAGYRPGQALAVAFLVPASRRRGRAFRRAGHGAAHGCLLSFGRSSAQPADAVSPA